MDRGQAQCVHRRMKLAVLSLLFALGCSRSQPPPATPGSAAPASAAAQETGAATSCQADADCYCRIFNGAEFQPGREPSTCCLEAAGCTDAVGATVAANHCMTCVYD